MDLKMDGAMLEGLALINPDNFKVYIMNGKVSLECVRAGTGSMLALLYIIPEGLLHGVAGLALVLHVAYKIAYWIPGYSIA